MTSVWQDLIYNVHCIYKNVKWFLTFEIEIEMLTYKFYDIDMWKQGLND
jgi:hypothetical protein